MQLPAVESEYVFPFSIVESDEYAAPSKDMENYWYEESIRGGYEGVGKFMVYVDVSELDETWSKVRVLLKERKLGGTVKTATGKPNLNALNDRIKVIIIYTDTSTDMDELARIAWNLFEAKVFKSGVLNYKTHEATLNDEYARNNQGRVSKYSIGIHSFSINNSPEKLAAFLRMKYPRA